MPEKIKEVWKKVRLPFLRAAVSLRRKAENSTLVKTIAGYLLGRRFLMDTVFRSGVSLCLSLVMNFTYGAVQFFVGIYSKSVWMGALAVYHILLAAMQFRLTEYMNKNDGKRDELAELRLYRFCGGALLLMTPIFASILILIVHKNSRAGYPGFLIYFAAVIAFTKIGVAVFSTVKFRKYGSPVLSAAKTLSLIAAMISVLSLETAVLSRYGSMTDPVFYQGMLGTVGGAVCVFTLGKSLSMIIQATQQLKVKSSGR